MQKSPGKRGIRSARHHAFNDLFARSFAAASSSCNKGAGWVIADGREKTRWCLTDPMAERLRSKSLCCDVTVTCQLAESYIDRAAHEAGAAAEMAAFRVLEK